MVSLLKAISQLQNKTNKLMENFENKYLQGLKRPYKTFPLVVVDCSHVHVCNLGIGI